MTKENRFLEGLDRLRCYCEKENFSGYDPFDGLNSLVFKSIPIFKNIALFRLAWIQFFKRCPVNLRPLFFVKKSQNPKGLGLFLTGYCNLYRLEPRKEYLDKIKYLVGQIMDCRSEGYSGACWGYNFDWQSKAFFQPKWTPSIVVSSFVACALLDAYSVTGDKTLLATARSTADFMLRDLNRTPDADGNFCFSYCPLDRTQVFNASLLGSRLLSRLYALTGEKLLIEEARRAVAFACNSQRENGSWPYSPLPFHRWIDNFHTGYNLECISEYQKASGDRQFNSAFERGMDYYLKTFFRPDGAPAYFSDRLYPIDMHAVGQLLVTLSRTGRLAAHRELAEKTLEWSFDNMFDRKSGCFYYQKLKHLTNRTRYMRWTEAWMFLGLSYYVSFYNNID
jgi:rhamnogalacturonyl hydrolase YesR